MKLLLIIVKLSVYSVLTYLVMLFIAVLRFPKSENNQKLLVGQNSNLSINVNPNVTVTNNVNLSCLKESASLIVVVKSKIDNFERRKNIRWEYVYLFVCIVCICKLKYLYLYTEIFLFVCRDIFICLQRYMFADICICLFRYLYAEIFVYVC